jgi:hypothetical protein
MDTNIERRRRLQRLEQRSAPGDAQAARSLGPRIAESYASLRALVFQFAAILTAEPADFRATGEPAWRLTTTLPGKKELAHSRWSASSRRHTAPSHAGEHQR